MRLLMAGIASMIIFGCTKPKPESKETAIDTVAYAEQYRPQFHFSPQKNWTNDPNGVVFYEGEYHLFYQYNPYGLTWGHMSWGHAVSKDLLHWEHLPVAIAEYQDRISGDSTMVFSGTTVVDKNNSSGLCSGPDCLVAVYTSHVHKNGQGLLQHQSLAYSNDKGRTWTQYDKNPVLSINRKDFRDPKIFWHEPTKSWVMILVIPDEFKAQLYKSTNLKEWSLMSEFGNIGDRNKIWECPDLYQLPVANEPGKSKWVLSLSGSHPAGPTYVGVQYFIGDFDGSKFTADDPKQPPLYVEYGKDFYAGIVYNNIPKEDGRTIMMAWGNNWAYGNAIPTSTWRSAMALPRELSLKKTKEGIRLIQQPIPEATSLRDAEITGTNSFEGNQLELEINTSIASLTSSSIDILKGEGDKTLLSFNKETSELTFDRTSYGNSNFHKDFPTSEKIRISQADELTLHLFIDHSLVEVFVNDGELALTQQIFPLEKVTTYKVAENPAVKVKGWKIRSVW